MARKSQGPFYYASKKGFFAYVRNERIRLTSGPDTPEERERAEEEYEKAVAARADLKDADKEECWWVLNGWLKHRANGAEPVSASTHAIDCRYVRSFVAIYGRVKWFELTPQHFDNWLAAMKQTAPKARAGGRAKGGWGKGGRRLAVEVLRKACNWAQESGAVTRNPFKLASAKKLAPKTPNYRGKRLAVEDHEHRAMLALAMRYQNRDFLHYLMLTYATGARPAELYLARADEWDPAKKAFVISPEGNQGRYKMAHRGEDRVVRVPDYLVPVVHAQLRKYPEGPLFRTLTGKPYNTNNLNKRFENTIDAVNQKAGREVIRPALIPYSYRHGFVTRWLLKGRDPMRLCELIQTSLTQLHKTYSHLFEKHEELSDELNRFSAAG
jgi:integrase